MTSPNPFADDPQPEGAQRLQSAADPLNPYAAPAGTVDGRGNHGPGIGLWRDGKFLVMHLEAKFPPRCIYTNEPADVYHSQNLSWSYRVDISRRKLPIQFGVSEQGMRQIERNRRNWMLVGYVSTACGVFFLLSAVITFYFEISGFVEGVGNGILFSVVVAVIAFVQARKGGSPFLFRSAKESYLWLIGTPPPFLNSLPQWPGLG